MSEHKKHYRLGIFVLLSTLIGLGLLVGLGAGKWFSTNARLETYFDESVQGVDIGSKIRYRGVVVGEVSGISFTRTAYELDKPAAQRQQYVMVTARVQPDMFGGDDSAFPDQATLDREIARGLRIKLTPQGLTGTSYLEIDFTDPAENPPLAIHWNPENFYIPTARSTVKQFVDGAQDAMARLQRIDIEGMVSHLSRILALTEEKIAALPLESIGHNLDRVSGELADAQIGQLSREATALLSEVRTSNRALQGLLSDPAIASAPVDLALAAKRAREIMENPQIDQAVTHLNRALGRMDRLLTSRDQEIASLVDNLNEISANLRSLTETADRHPAGLLLGAPPKPYEPPQ